MGKLSDHIDVVATCANRHKEEIQNIKTLLKTNSPLKDLSSAVSALSQENNENQDKIKNFEETTSVLTIDIKIISNSISRLWKDKVDTDQRNEERIQLLKTA